ncbi:MAG: ATP-dependent helicase [Phycisphaerales bacterium]
MAEERNHNAGANVQGLNEAQREAVLHEGCPLIVLAGPGTGKTRVIVHRVAHLIAERGVEPERILMTTFTVKAANELRERLGELVGDAKAERVNAHTLHGLGLRLIRRFGDCLDLPPIVGGLGTSDDVAAGDGAGMARRTSLIDSAQAKRLLVSLILEHDLFGSERSAGVESLALSAQRHFDHFDDRALSPADTAAMTARWSAAIERGEDLRGRALAGDELEAEAARQARFGAMASLHRAYVDERRRRGLLSFGDLLMLPIRLLRERADVASIVRQELRHVIVDEFQDVNRANIELLALLAPPEKCRGEGRAAGQELVVVGDDDQAIYGFRGSDDRAFWRFESIWKDTRRIALTENYRSRPRIIAVANSVIARAEARFAPDKTIELARAADPEPPGVVECVNLTDEMADGEVIATMIRSDASATRAEGKNERPIDWRRYAVVVRNGGDAERVREALWLEGIPSVFDRASSVADDPGFQATLAWARLIVHPRQAWCARSLLLRPPMSVPIETISAWERQYRSAASRWRASDSGGLEGAHDDPGGYVGWLAAREGDLEPVRRLAELYRRFGSAAAEQPAASVLHEIVRDAGVVHADLPDDAARLRRVQAVVALLRFARERQPRLPAPGGLREFLEYYEDLSGEESRLDRGDVGARIDGGDTGVAGDDPGANAVRLITAHGAKGLEFDTVFVPRVHSQHGYGKVREPDEPTLPPGLAPEVGPSLDGKDRVRAEERRVFYVACTRAKQRLVLVAKRNKGRSKGANYFEEIVSETALSASGVVQELWQADVLARVSGTSVRAEAGVLNFKDDQRRREVLSRARTDLRLTAAGALARLDRPGADAQTLSDAMAELDTVARRLAGVAAIEQGRAVPPVCRDPDPFLDRLRLATRTAPAAAGGAEGPRSMSAIIAPQRAPLRLSYTSVSDYLRCPKCWYLKHVLGLEEESLRPQLYGLVLHRTLEKFYAALRGADADGREPPSLAALESMTRREYLGAVGDSGEASRGDLDRLLHQVRNIHQRLHDPATQVLEIERNVRFRYAPAGDEAAEHVFEAKIDRVDLITMPDGSAGYRIVDYKSGEDWKSLVEPENDDLQLVIYAMAWRKELGAEVPGVAEYWVAKTGQRGGLRFEDMRFDKVRAQIDKAIAGMLAGVFDSASGCEGVCRVLGP